MIVCVCVIVTCSCLTGEGGGERNKREEIKREIAEEKDEKRDQEIMEKHIEEQTEVKNEKTGASQEEMIRLKRVAIIAIDLERREEVTEPMTVVVTDLDHHLRPIVRGADPLVPHTVAGAHDRPHPPLRLYSQVIVGSHFNIIWYNALPIIILIFTRV